MVHWDIQPLAVSTIAQAMNVMQSQSGSGRGGRKQEPSQSTPQECAHEDQGCTDHMVTYTTHNGIQ